ncbi:adenylyl-sulfate kinase [Roseococcus pinisoli]|uniref:Adenylyl-sulfate kinase n=1 Tax=Roseococcus pinisoli TaxID=2835040 RepID=A0ABS5QI90_9PROT|nr:adenylyl-sulfate kinase [Roseococcus pinisoli]
MSAVAEIASVGNAQRDAAFPVVIVGHVDHGKSTLVGRLLHDTGAIPAARIAALREQSARRGLDLEFSFLLDSLQIERDQGITVDAAQVWFRGAERRYAVLDAPGHAEFLRNMVTGAAQAEAAVLVVDAEQGVGEQTRRHLYLLSILSVSTIVVALNKMDRVEWSEARFEELRVELAEYLGALDLVAQHVVPLSARHGDNVVTRSEAAPWYAGPSLIGALDGLPPRRQPTELALRLPVQDVYRLGERRVLVGRIETGRLGLGEEIVLAPGGRTAKVLSLEHWGGEARSTAGAGESVAVLLDKDVFAERGQVLGPAAAPPSEAHALTVRLFWLDTEPLLQGERLTLRHGTAETRAAVEAIDAVIDVDTLTSIPAERLERNGVARARLRARRPLALDTYGASPRTGRGVLVRNHRIVGGFVVEALEAAGSNLTAVEAPLSAEERAQVNGHRGGVLWLTGLSGSGKSTLAARAVRELAARGIQATLLDGDNLRRGLNRDLGFRPEDRAENVRRTAEAAALVADAGLVAVVALISPMAAHRADARRIVGERFREVYLSTDLATCEARDPKGLYRRAREDRLADFTGISAPYEAPRDAELVLDTGALDEDVCTRSLLALTLKAFRLQQAGHGD